MSSKRTYPEESGIRDLTGYVLLLDRGDLGMIVDVDSFLSLSYTPSM